MVAFGLVFFASPGARYKLRDWHRRRGQEMGNVLFDDGRGVNGRVVEEEDGRYAPSTVLGMKNALSTWCVACERRLPGPRAAGGR